MDIKYIYIPDVYTNCYIIGDQDTGAAAIIDPGADVNDDVKRFLKDTGWKLRAIFLTHGHYDHVGGVKALRKLFPDVPVYLHPGDAEKDSQLFPTAKLGQVTLWRDGDVVPVGNLQVEVLHTPGHSKGSVVLKCQDVLFTGDTLFAGSAGRTDLPGGDGEELMESLRRLARLEGEFQVLPGHEAFASLEQERQSNPFLRQAMGE